MSLHHSLLNGFLTEISLAKNQPEVASILGATISKYALVHAFQIEMSDDHEGMNIIAHKGSISEVDQEVLSLHNGSNPIGVLRYSHLNMTLEQKQILSLLHSVTVLKLGELSNQDSLYQNSRVLERKSLLINTFIEMLSEIIMQTMPNGIAAIAGQFLMGQLLTSSFAVLQNNEKGNFEILASNGIDDKSVWSFLHDDNSNIAITSSGEYFSMPVIHGQKQYGSIIIGPRADRKAYSQDDYFFISTLGKMIAIALERVHLQREEKKLMLLQREMDIAAIVQSRLFPSFANQYANCEIAGIHIPTLEIGGDYMDVIPYPDGSLALIMADVSGKGIGSAMIMSMVKASFSLLVKQQKDPKEILQVVNNLLFEHTNSDIFVTCIFMKINPERTRIISINAGHEPPFLMSLNGQISSFTKGCMVLGVMSHLMHIESDEISLNRGDLLCLYTDGIFDSSQSNNHRIKEILSQLHINADFDVQDYLKILVGDESQELHLSGSDDKSLLLLRIE
jgi:sigma-B regulation protein RsbU (phosphoserine phosphatase)